MKIHEKKVNTFSLSGLSLKQYWPSKNAHQTWQHWRDVMLPPACALCRSSVQTPHSLCAECWQQLDFYTPPFCLRCGFRQAYATGNYCASCLHYSTPWQQFRAPLVYNDTSALLIMGLKYYDRYNMIPMLIQWLYRATKDLPTPDFIIPVPLHRWRLWQRRYNQSALLAQRLAEQYGIPEAYQPLWLGRKGWFRSQRRLNTQQRIDNVQGKFVLYPRQLPSQLEGKQVWLIDDVVTSGATVQTISKLLQPLGVKMSIVTLARVPGILPSCKIFSNHLPPSKR